jgi:hypothetical protein
MPGLGRKTFTPLEVLTAANVNGFLMDQTVMKFASATARSSAIGTALSSGMVTFRVDGTAWEGYNGTSWVPLVNVDTSAFITASSTATLTNKSIDASQITTIVNTVTGAYTATTGDRNETILANSGSAFTITVPDVFNIGDRIDVIRDGAGTVSLAAGTGITTWSGAGTAGTAVTFKIDQQFNGATVQKVAANSYRVIGKIAP